MSNNNRLVLCHSPIYDACYMHKGLTETPTKAGIRQAIPYVIVMNKRTQRIALFQRKTGDSRLVGGYIIGVGGHVEIEDAVTDERSGFLTESALFHAAMREIREELGIRPKPESLHQMQMAEIRLSDNPVNSAHLGIVYTYETSARSMKNVPEDELEFIGWKTKKELKTYELESWSQFVLENAL